MRNSRNSNRDVDLLSSIPSFLKPAEGVFEDIEHYRAVAGCISRALAITGRKKRSPISVPGSALYDGFRVEFSSSFKEEEIYLDNFASKVILRAPKRRGESQASLHKRRMFYLEHLVRSAEAMKTTGIAYIYLSLKEEGRRKASKTAPKHSGSKK